MSHFPLFGGEFKLISGVHGVDDTYSVTSAIELNGSRTMKLRTVSSSAFMQNWR